MRFITGDECGLLKECIPELSRKPKDPEAAAIPNNSIHGITKNGVSRIDPKEKQTRERGIVDMMWMRPYGHDVCESVSFATLRKNGSVEIWNAIVCNTNFHGRYSLEHASNNVFGKVDSQPLGLGVFHNHQRICAGDMQGNVVVLSNDDRNCLDIVHTYNAYSSSNRNSSISYTPGKATNTQLATAIAFDSAHGHVAVGGRERETCLIDITTGKQVFKTKNLPPDPQTLLQQPVWPTAIEFLNNNVMAVGTAYKQIRLYDVRESSKMRRPTHATPEELLEYRVTSLCPVSDHELVIGDAAGYICTLDLRRLGRDLKAASNRDMARYVGPAGSVRQIKKHPTLPRLASVGLDRMLRVYDTKTRRQLHCVYLKQRLNCLLVHGDLTWDEDCSPDPDDLDIDQDDVVQDYIDSDDGKEDEDATMDGSETRSDSSTSQRDGNESQDGDGVDASDGETVEVGKQKITHRNDQNASAKESNERVEASNNQTKEDDTDANTDSSEDDDVNEDDDEIIVVKAAKRRKR